jgi:hypothetical protein
MWQQVVAMEAYSGLADMIIKLFQRILTELTPNLTADIL